MSDPALVTGAAGDAAGDPEFVQLLTPQGERVEHPEYGVDFSPDEYRALYHDLCIVRRLDTEALALCRQGEMGIWASLLGQEAAQVGSARALRPDDMVFPTYREHGVAYCRGVDTLRMVGVYRGVSHGGWDPTEKNFHLYTIVIGNQALHATGYAMGVQKDGGESAVIAYFGDGASSQGDTNEAFVFASVYHAPVVFFCQNNQWAISEPIERQSRVPLYHRARGFGFPGTRVDGNDVLACYAVTRKALDHARSGQGPSLVEAYTYRMGAHTTTDDPTRYRTQSELDHWAVRDPIARVRKFLTNERIGDDDFFASVDADADQVAATFRQGVLDLPNPEPTFVFDHAYAEPHPLVDEERAAMTDYLSSFEGSH
jgi:2-oxoisovalerate dehydrogenase E1 component alpha subunit